MVAAFINSSNRNCPGQDANVENQLIRRFVKPERFMDARQFKESRLHLRAASR
jgi:hypothetical protein